MTAYAFPGGSRPLWSWPGLSFPLAPRTTPSPVVFTVQTVFAEIVSPDRKERYPLTHFESLSVNEDKHGMGDAELVSLYSAPWFQTMMNHATYGRPYMWGLDFYWRNSATPLWSGVIQGRLRRSHGGTRSSARVRVPFESFQSHFLRRRIITLGAGERFPVDVAVAPMNADLAAIGFIDHCLGYSNFLTAANYNGYERNEMGPGSLWTVTYAGFPTPPNSGPSIWVDFQGNLNLRTAILYILEEGGITLTLAESPAATWTWDVSDPYVSENLSGSIEISQDRGTLGAFAFEEDYTPVNAWHMMGNGIGALQPSVWKTDPSTEGGGGSGDDIGLFEDSGTMPGMANTSALGAKGDHLLGFTADAENEQAYEITVTEQGAHLFGADWGPRNTVHVRDTIFDIASDRTCIGYTIRMDHAGQIRLVAKFDNPVKSMTAALRKFKGSSFGAGATSGGEYAQKGG